MIVYTFHRILKDPTVVKTCLDSASNDDINAYEHRIAGCFFNQVIHLDSGVWSTDQNTRSYVHS
jgi:hypothetical protein